MLKLLLSLCLLLTGLVSKTVEAYVNELYQLPKEKKLLLMHAYLIGLHTGWENTLPAIAWKESNFEPAANHKDGVMGSYGYYQVQLYYFLKAKGIKITEANKEKYKNYLLENMVQNAWAAVDNLNYWSKRYGGQKQLTKILASYNGGSNGINIPKAKAYAEDVKKRMKAIQIVLTTKHLDILLKDSYIMRTDVTVNLHHVWADIMTRSKI